MEITPNELVGQYHKAMSRWPFIHRIEVEFNLPFFIMFAIGSRETNLENIEGDYRDGRYNGFGVWQRDIQHGVPDWWFTDVEGQCRWSAGHLNEKIAVTGSFREGVRAYNGSGPAARAYRDDVLERMGFLASNFPKPTISTNNLQEIAMSYGLIIHPNESVAVPFSAPMRGPVAQVSVRLQSGSDCKVKWSHINSKGWASGVQEGTVKSGGEIGIPIPESDPPHTAVQVHNLGTVPLSVYVEMIPRLAFADGK